MPDPSEPEVVVFGSKAKREIDPEKEAEYAEKIRKAKEQKGGINSLKGSTPVGHIERPHLPLLQRQRDGDAPPAGLSETGGVQPRPPGSPLLSPQTQQELEGLAKTQGEQIAKDAAADPAEKKEEPSDIFDVFDFYGRDEASRILNNKKRRADIESRCQPMNFEDLIYKDEVHQTVDILPGKFAIELRSLLPSESLHIKQFMGEHQNKTEQYLQEKYSLCQLACSVMTINGKPLGAPHIDENGEVVEKVFLTKLKSIIRKSGYIVADLGIQYAWFDVRVRKLFNPDDLGNG